MTTSEYSCRLFCATVSAFASCKEAAPPAPQPAPDKPATIPQPPIRPASGRGDAEPAARIEPTMNRADAGARLSEKELIYGIKTDHRVVVYRRNLQGHSEKKVLTYEEHKKAAGTGNYWEGLPPSLALSHDAKSLSFVDRDGLHLLDLSTNRSRTLIKKKPPLPAQPPDVAPDWSVKGLADVSHLASPQWSPGDRTISVRTVFLEGGGFGLVDVKSGGYQSLVEASMGAEGISWSPSGNAVAVVVSGAEGMGLHLASGPRFAPMKNLAAKLRKGHLPFHEASFSPAGDRIAITYSDEEAVEKGVTDDSPQIRTMAVVGIDGKGFSKLTRGFVGSPLYVKDGTAVVYVETNEMKQRVMRHNLATKKSTVVVGLPDGFEEWDQASFTRDGNLFLVGRSRTRDGKAVLVILDLSQKEITYKSPVVSRFTTFAGVL